MVKELSYSTISRVLGMYRTELVSRNPTTTYSRWSFRSASLETWELARRRPDFEEYVGSTMLLKMFEYEPETKKVFGFDVEFNPTAQELKDAGHLHVAVSILQRFDASLNLMGPDHETLEEVLTELGKRHIGYGVKAHYFPFMGKAIVFALKETLGDKFTPEVHAAWNEVYQEISGAIMKAILIGSS